MFVKCLCNPSSALTSTALRRQTATRTNASCDASTAATSILPPGEKLSHQSVEDLTDFIRANRLDSTIVVDMRNIEDASTAAFAKLVLLRRELLSHGRDLRLRGMRNRVASMWRISRLASVLPVQ